MPRAKRKEPDTELEAPPEPVPALAPFELRPYQQAAEDAFDAGRRRQVLIWHRRAGKDAYALHRIKREAARVVGAYWLAYPLHVQARRAIWNGIGKDGVPFIERAFPSAERAATRDQDMFLELRNGSTVQLVGSDFFDRLVGSNPRGVAFSEWALCDPNAWNYIRPILRENQGWVLFISTYRGRNHCYQMAQSLRADPAWYVDVRTVEQTTDRDGNRIITADDIAAERREGMAEALIEQEYFCRVGASVAGAIYGRGVADLERGGRLTHCAYDPRRPVFAAWCVEHPEAVGVVMAQGVGNESRVIYSRVWPFTPLHEALADVRELPWKAAVNILPSQKDFVWAQLFEDAALATDHAPELREYVSVTRALLPLLSIDIAPRAYSGGHPNNEVLLDSLRGYRTEPSTKHPDTFSSTPEHTYERYLCRALELYAAWKFDNGDAAGDWHAPPSYAARDRAAI